MPLPSGCIVCIVLIKMLLAIDTFWQVGFVTICAEADLFTPLSSDRTLSITLIEMLLAIDTFWQVRLAAFLAKAFLFVQIASEFTFYRTTFFAPMMHTVFIILVFDHFSVRFPNAALGTDSTIFFH